MRVSEHVANAGVAIVASAPDALVEPWFLGSLNEDDVQGYPGTPVNVNGLTFEYQFDNQSAAVDFPHEGRYFVSVDSRADPYTNLPLRGEYLLHSWQNDVTPPRFKILTKVVTPGRPLIAGIVSDRGAGVDPLSLVIGYKQTLLLAALYDPGTGLVLWALDGAPKIGPGRRRCWRSPPTTRSRRTSTRPGTSSPTRASATLQLRAVRRPTVNWLLPQPLACAARVERLFVTAGATRGVRSVRFLDGKRLIATERRGSEGLFGAPWRTAKARAGRHVLRAVVTDRRGATASATRAVRVCR